ncbi:VWA domain-containing protein [Streptomyces sp. S07_1.15]|uniref:vWA domain-containing protein n=1 Tax=Streptomyces sp. S07_1.15 TaxID=2873925 RepID=UPI001D15A0D0|nr:vWA domain-containing protein [Streptomyces sp. S07_1.15]MCC3653856.1 VWA domain-containing protein [Streptomyces sp. S07_1.15]
MRNTSRTRTLAGALLGLAAMAATTAAGPAAVPGASAPLAASVPAGARAAAAEGADPVDFAVVVDQSKSLSADDLAREVEAAALIAQGEISERSRATVIGFGSSEKPGQSAVREVCQLTVADAVGRDHLSDCVKKLSRRDERKMGPGTDFPAALRQALDRLTEDGEPATPRVVFLLTDGRLDVRDSRAYGDDPRSRTEEAEKQLAEQLARAREESVQIWPLGFGDVDRKMLTAMAAGGYRNGCADLPSARPRPRVLDGSAEIGKVLQETFAAARCARVAQGTVGKPPADLTVTIPEIATDGSITVSKHDPKVTATYYDPRGRKVPTRGTFDGSVFEATGQNGPVEALRVKNPRPGTWRVHLEAPEGHRGREVTVRAIWQGKLRSAVTLDPASPRPGEKTVVEVRMQTRRGVVVDDPRLLKGIKVSAQLSGSGFDSFSVPLADDGKGPDRRAGDVRFTGTLTVPDGADGDLALRAGMSAPGVTGDRRPLNARVTLGTPPVKAALTVERGSVHPGGEVRGRLEVRNSDSTAHTLRLALADRPPGGGVRITPATVEVPAEGRKSVPLTLSLDPDVAPGEIGGRITVADADDDGRILDNGFIGVVVEPVPTLWDEWWGAFLAAAVLLLGLAAFAAVRLRARNRRRDLTGVRLELRGDGIRPDELTVRPGQSSGGEFRFTVDRARGAAPALRRAGPGAAAVHRLRRSASGRFLFRPDGGRDIPLSPGGSASLGGGLEIVFHDRRSAASRRDGADGRRGARTSGGSRTSGGDGNRRWRRNTGRPGRGSRIGRPGDEAGRVPPPAGAGDRGAGARRPGGGASAPSSDERTAGASRFDPNF